MPLRRTFIGYDVVTAYAAGWATLRNGELLVAAETATFDVLIMTDQSLKHQQNLTDRRLAILFPGSTSWPRIRQHLAAIREAVDNLSNGMYREVPIPLTISRQNRVLLRASPGRPASMKTLSVLCTSTHGKIT